MSLAGRGLWYGDRHPGRWVVAALIVLLLFPPVLLVWPVLTDPTERFLERKGTIDKVSVTRQWQADGSRYENLTLTSSTGLQVEMMIRRPPVSDVPRPMVLLLGGYGTGRRAAQLVPDTHDVVIASLSYPYHGDRNINGVALLWNLDDIQQVILDTDPAVLLALDYLAQQPYVSNDHMELVGVSFGAFFVSIPGAMDQRFSRVWLVQGAAEPETVYEYRLRNKIKFDPLRSLVAKTLSFVTGSEYMNPTRWVGRISPRPVIVINSRNDPSFPPSSVAALHAALRKPYELEWLEGKHVTPGRKEVLRQLSERVLTRVAAAAR